MTIMSWKGWKGKLQQKQPHLPVCYSTGDQNISTTITINYYYKVCVLSLSCLQSCLSVSVPYQARHDMFLTVCTGREKKEKKTVLTQEPTKSNHSLWMAISRFDQVLCYSSQRAGGQERVKVTRLLSREKTRPDIMLSCHILLQ